MVSASSSRLFPSPRSRPFALLSALFQLRRHGVGAGMFMLRAWGNGACVSSHNRGVFRFLCHGMNSAGGGCRAVGMASAGRCAYFYQLARPLPLGAGEYVRPAGVGSACGEGVGGIVEVLLSIGSSSFHLFISVVIASLLASLPLVVLVVSSSLLPCFLRPFLSPVFSCCGFLSLPSPFLRLAGRGVLCLLAYALWLSFLSPCSPSVSCPLRLLACPGSRSLSVPLGVSLIVSCGYSVPPLVLFMSYRLLCSFVCPPRLATSMSGERGGSFLLACSCFRPVFPVVQAAG